MHQSLYALLASLLLLVSCSKSGDPYFQGYIEGEYLYLSAPVSGYLETLEVKRGTRAKEGQHAYSLTGDQDAEVGHAHTAALEAQLRAAESSFKFATSQLKRQEELEKDKFSSPSRTDELHTAQTQAAAQVRVLREQLANKSVRVPANGEITETFYHLGEWVSAGQAVASLLPDDKRRIRFFVPENIVATLHNGQAVEARCDGCSAAIAATINFIAAQAEYTPPVIYSQGSREKLVFRVEASPSSQDASLLRPGLPVEVRLK